MRRVFIPAAGLGSRLKPWTDNHPKALVPVGGEPMLKKVVTRLAEAGFDSAVVNIHHFADQIEEFVKGEDLPLEIMLSDERDRLLETGGGLLKASPLLFRDGCEDILVHNADILSDADLRSLYEVHLNNAADVTLLVSDRDSSRRLRFDPSGRLVGWENIRTGELRPAGFSPDSVSVSHAFSGIYVVNRRAVELMHEKGYSGAFPIMDFFLDSLNELSIKKWYVPDLKLTDVGKPDTLARVNGQMS